MNDIGFLHDYILDAENQLQDYVDSFCAARYGINKVNALYRLKKINAICENIKSMTEDIQEKVKECLSELEVHP